MTGTASIEGDKLTFELHAGDDILAFKRKLEVPLEHIVSVSTERVDWNYGKQIRLFGTGVPYVVKDGIYLSRHGVLFFEMSNPDKCVTVNLNHETYKQIVFEVGSKEAAAWMINDAIRKTQRST